MTQQEIIIRVLQTKGDWVPSYELEKVETPFGWIGTSGSRRCRELVEEGRIEHKREGKYVWYRAKQLYKVSMYESKYTVSPQGQLL